MRASQYVEQYLNGNAGKGWETGYTGYTVGTFIHYTVRGKAARYADRYQRALVRALERRREAGTVFAGPSVRGRTAYYPASAACTHPHKTVTNAFQVSIDAERPNLQCDTCGTYWPARYDD